MFPKHSLTIIASLMAGLLVTTPALGDRVYLIQPQKNETTLTAGCPVNVSFRVQYSDMAQLKWVQLQVLNPDQTVLENLDNSTRGSWDLVRYKTVVWNPPADLAPGDYVVKAFGDASYPCKDEQGHRTFCNVPLQDQETLHIVTAPDANDLHCPELKDPSGNLLGHIVPTSTSSKSPSETKAPSTLDPEYSTPSVIGGYIPTANSPPITSGVSSSGSTKDQQPQGTEGSSVQLHAQEIANGGNSDNNPSAAGSTVGELVGSALRPLIQNITMTWPKGASTPDSDNTTTTDGSSPSSSSSADSSSTIKKTLSQQKPSDSNQIQNKQSSASALMTFSPQTTTMVFSMLSYLLWANI